jgi:hypothetical protein
MYITYPALTFGFNLNKNIQNNYKMLVLYISSKSESLLLKVMINLYTQQIKQIFHVLMSVPEYIQQNNLREV